ncbi:MAG: hypothetical protein LBF97_00705 [Elusimicrobiota bacterium]|jgi:DNA repair exonuclease SbcCD nuclease subunit|nr:hypothetical protein [Elusimicrobiota bacterium]
MILFSSDWHLNDKQPIHNTIILNYMNYLQDYMKENDIKNFVFGGDLIHNSNKINYHTFVPVFKKFLEWKDIGIKSIFIIGNHDQLAKDNSLLELLEPLGKVIIKPETISIDGIDYDFCPYTENVEDLPNNSEVLFSHLDVKDFYFNKVKQSDNEYFTQESFHNYSLLISGHFHRQQTGGKVVYVGSPNQLNFNEEGEKKYFCVINDNEYNLVEIPNTVDYITIDLNNFKSYDRDIFRNKFVKVNISSKIENFVKLKNILYEYGAVDVVPNFIKEENIKDEEGHNIDLQKGVLSSMTKYLSEIKIKEIDNKKLLNVFKELLKEII